MKKKTLAMIGISGAIFAGVMIFNEDKIVVPVEPDPVVDTCVWAITGDTNHLIEVTHDDRAFCTLPTLVQGTRLENDPCFWTVVMSEDDTYELNLEEGFDPDSLCLDPTIECTGDGC